jgi:hypothetical protein
MLALWMQAAPLRAEGVVVASWLHARLKTVHIESQRSVQLTELLASLSSHEPIMPHDLAHNRSILLFDITLIVFQIRASSRKGDLFLFTITEQHLIDEFPSVVGVEPQDGKRKEGPCLLQRF